MAGISTEMVVALRQPLRNAGKRLFSSAGSAQAGEHGESAFKLWKGVSLFFGVPVLVTSSLYIIPKDIREHPEPPEYLEYEHLRIRKKNFPWGNGKRTLFHNPHANPIPGVGYEEDPHHHH